MANRQTYVIGALGVLAGMVVGANSAQRADMTVSYLNPNTAQEGVVRRGDILRSRSANDNVPYYVGPRLSPFGDNVIGNIRDERLSRLYGSAPRALGVEVEEPVYLRCYGLSGKRQVRCERALFDGDAGYEMHYFE